MPPPRRDPEGARDMREINLREYEKSPGVPFGEGTGHAAGSAAIGLH